MYDSCFNFERSIDSTLSVRYECENSTWKSTIINKINEGIVVLARYQENVVLGIAQAKLNDSAFFLVEFGAKSYNTVGINAFLPIVVTLNDTKVVERVQLKGEIFGIENNFFHIGTHVFLLTYDVDKKIVYVYVVGHGLKCISCKVDDILLVDGSVF